MTSLFVSGLPIAQGRPRFKVIRMGQFTNVRAYDPERSVTWKEHVRAQAKMWAGPSAHELLNGSPMALHLRFVLPRPRNIPKRVTQHVKKPDLDNLVKAVKDALTGVLYARDSQVVTLVAHKVYGKKPGVHIAVKEVA